MFKIKVNIMITVLVILFLLTSYSTTFAESGVSGSPQPTPINTPPDVKVQIVTSPPNDDSNWPITSVKFGQSEDPLSGQIIYWKITTRENPNSLPSGKSGCADNLQLAPLDTCTFIVDETTDFQGSLSGVTLYITHYAHRYCSISTCAYGTVYHKPYQLNVSWTRPNSNYSVRNSHTRWGCANCRVCSTGAIYNNIWDSGAFTPAWNDSTHSMVYVYTLSSWPVMQGVAAYSSAVTGNNSGDIYNGNTYQGLLGGSASWPAGS